MIIEINGHRIEIYDNIQSLPILRFQKLNKYSLIASEVGNTFEDYDARTNKTLELLHKGLIDEAMQELNNRRQMVFNAFNEFTPQGKAFASLIKSIDESIYLGNDSSELDEILSHLNRIGLSYYDSIEKLIDVKKKSNTNWKFIFPIYFQKMIK